MKKAIITFLLGILPILVFGQNELLFSQANESYNKGNYAKSVKLYEEIEKSGNVSSNLYFNLANSYYKLQKIAPSIYNYEKALRLAPNDKTILENYSFAKNARIDKIDVLPKGFLNELYLKLVRLLKVDTWAWLSISFIFIFSLCFVLFYKSVAPQQRKLFFSGCTLSFLISLFCFVFAFLTEQKINNEHYAIIYSSEVNIQSEPNLRSEKLFTLHEGTKVKTLELVDDWKKIELSDGKTGWIPRKEIKEL